MIVYRKVKVSERLPKCGFHNTNIGFLEFDGLNFITETEKICYVKYWLEEVILPNEEEIWSHFEDVFFENHLYGGSSYQDQLDGANYILNKLK